jgi:4-aminobutyrate aminotransferase-like enzyme
MFRPRPRSGAHTTCTRYAQLWLPGSPVSSVVGLTVLDVIRDERLPENARLNGA